MPKLLYELKEAAREALCERDLLRGSRHQKVEHVVLLIRNLAAGTAFLLFLASLLHAPAEAVLKGIAYIFGAAHISVKSRC